MSHVDGIGDVVITALANRKLANSSGRLFSRTSALVHVATSTAVVANTRRKDGNCRLSSQPRGGIAAAGYEHPSFLGIFADCQHTLVFCT